jgi:uncharacterized membrane protein
VGDLMVAAIVFLGAHLGISSTPLRDQVVRSVGERPYLALFSLTAFATLAWLVLAYRAAPFLPLWGVPYVSRYLPAIVMLPALFLLVCSLTAPNPTAVGQSPDADAPEPATGILRVTRHPFMWAVGLWAVVHVIVNGDEASLVLFGTMAILAFWGSALIDAKRSRASQPGWGVFLQRTSNIPFLAIVQGRQHLELGEFRLVQVALTLILYAVLLAIHGWLFGVSPLPG